MGSMDISSSVHRLPTLRCVTTQTYHRVYIPQRPSEKDTIEPLTSNTPRAMLQIETKYRYTSGILDSIGHAENEVDRKGAEPLHIAHVNNHIIARVAKFVLGVTKGHHFIANGMTTIGVHARENLHNH